MRLKYHNGVFLCRKIIEYAVPCRFFRDVSDEMCECARIATTACTHSGDKEKRLSGRHSLEMCSHPRGLRFP